MVATPHDLRNARAQVCHRRRREPIRHGAIADLSAEIGALAVRRATRGDRADLARIRAGFDEGGDAGRQTAHKHRCVALSARAVTQ